ncbi:RNA polymerase subunit sigma-24 [Herbiconiux moechotypicola]|uniref:RNA polymerase sigma factor SigJ n=1 Tax=Herbiconiux moechotypicola TaxID=637393 RepID=A0ABN3DCV5_9MICO|nr:sigma factor [Herbiconiux moechotypicola]MCS5728724.1 RNA polymerase subunit sigma-24 [Herbiconiux moechotypicola]
MADELDAPHPRDARDGLVLAERRNLLGLGYRMTGTLADAEDVVQESYARWYRLTPAERDAVLNPAAWLTRVAGRVALDLLGSARARREHYVGQWLPEPLPAGLFTGTGSAAPASLDPLERVALDDTVGSALLLVLETMTPAERVAFVLHDVFAVPFDQIASIVDRSPAAARQLASAARSRLRSTRTATSRNPNPVSPRHHDDTVRAFLSAARTGDLLTLMAVLSPEIELRSDGGGVVNAARQAVHGTDHVARFVLGVLSKNPHTTFTEQPTADGLGYRLDVGGRLYGIVTFDVADGLVTSVRLMLNPAKLTSWPSLP